jgi:protein ImuB
MHWIALQPQPEPEPEPTPAEEGISHGASDAPAALADGITALGWWALQFTPKVALVAMGEAEKDTGRARENQGAWERKSVLVLEVSASERLFGGRQQLLEKIYQSNKPFSHVLYAKAATSLIAIAKLQIKPFALFTPSASSVLSSPRASPRASPHPSLSQSPRPSAQQSLSGLQADSLADSLPLTTLAVARAHLPTLARMGCTTWGQLRALPRGGVVRRFGADLLDALDRAYGDTPELYPWLVLPEVLDVTLELQAQVETAPALMFSARRLLAQMQVWLQMRQCGVLAFELGWTMDARRNTATTGALAVRTAEPTRDMAHLQRLLAEHLARLTLPAPVLYLHLRTLQVEKLGAGTASLLLEDLRPGDSLHQLLERLSARLGASQVLQLQAQADHRPECMQTWQSTSNATQLIANYSIRTWEKSKKHSQINVEAPNQAQNNAKNSVQTRAQAQAQTLQADALYPTWLLAPPLKLPVHHNTPQCVQGGPLTLLAGPQRVEAGWWIGQKRDDRNEGKRGASKTGVDGSARGAPPPPPPSSSSSSSPCALRDYFLARSEQMGLLWIYRERLGGQGTQSGAGPSAQTRADAGADQNADGAGWYLHGLFA